MVFIRLSKGARLVDGPLDLWIPAFAGMTTKGGKRGNDDQSANGDRREMTTHARMNDRTNN